MEQDAGRERCAIEWQQEGHWLAISGHRHSFALGYSINHVAPVIAQVAYGDLTHSVTVSPVRLPYDVTLGPGTCDLVPEWV